ncbi:MAG: hypothetical protein AAFU85_18855 [Planctomycetota bacterium]
MDPTRDFEQVTESSEDSSVNPYAPTAETATPSSESVGGNRHPAKWPLLVAGALLFVPVILTLVSPSRGQPINWIQWGTILFNLVLAMSSLLLGFLPYTKSSRSLSIILGGLTSGMIGVLMLFGSVSRVSIGILALFFWVFVASIMRSPNAKEGSVGDRDRV